MSLAPGGRKRAPMGTLLARALLNVGEVFARGSKHGGWAGMSG